MAINGLDKTIETTSWSFSEGVASFIEDKNSSVVLMDDGRTNVYGRGRMKDRKLLIEVSGVTSTDGIKLDLENKIITISESSLSQTEAVTISYEIGSEESVSADYADYSGFMLTLDEDVPLSSELDAEGWTFDEETSTATYKGNGRTAGYIINNNTISYLEEEEGDVLVEVVGVTSTDGLSVDFEDKVVTVSADSLSEDSVVRLGEDFADYALALGEDVDLYSEKDETSTWKISGTTASYVNGTTSYGYAIEDGQIVYKSTSTDDALVTVEGVTSTEGLEIDTENNVVTISAASLSENSTVKVSEGYTLALGEDVTPYTQTNANEWVLEGNVASYVTDSTEYGYKLNDDATEISYTSNVENNTLVTVTGVKSTEGLVIDTENQTVTISASSLNQSDVTISEGYTLILGSDVTEPVRSLSGAGWVLEGMDGFGYSAHANIVVTQEGYTLKDNQIIYTSDQENESVTVFNISSVDGLELDIENKIVTVSEVSLQDIEDPVRVTTGYKLALGNDVKQPTKEYDIFSYNGFNEFVTYSGREITSGHTLTNSDEMIIWVDSESSAPVSIGGTEDNIGIVAGAVSSIRRSGDKFIIPQSAISMDEDAVYDDGHAIVTLNVEGYTFGLGDGIKKPEKTIKKGWQLSGASSAVYNTGETTSGLVLSRDKESILYAAAVENTVLAEVSGIKSIDGLEMFEENGYKGIAVYKEAFNGTDITLNEESEYELELGDVSNPGSGEGWVFDAKNHTAEYRDENWMKEGYQFVNSKLIRHVDEQIGGINVSLTGLAAAVDFKQIEVTEYDEDSDEYTESDYDDTTVQLTTSNFQDSVAVVSNSAALKFDIEAGDYGYDAVFTGLDDEKDVVTNNGNAVRFELGGGNDELESNGEEVFISGGAGKDKLFNTGKLSTVYGGAYQLERGQSW